MQSELISSQLLDSLAGSISVACNIVSLVYSYDTNSQ